MNTNYQESSKNLFKAFRHPIESSLGADKLEPEEIIRIVTQLIRWYQHHRSTQIAMSISQYIEALMCHQNAENLDDHTLCEYHRLSKHWKYLASVKPRYFG